MSQGYSYNPPTLEEAIKAYHRAKEKSKQVDNYHNKINQNHNFPNSFSHKGNLVSKTTPLFADVPHFRRRRRGYSQGSMADVGSSDNETSDDSIFVERRHLRKNSQKWRSRKQQNTSKLKNKELAVPNTLVPAWGQVPMQQFPVLGGSMLMAPPLTYPNMYPSGVFPGNNPYQTQYFNVPPNVPPPQYFYQQPPPFHVPGMYQNVQQNVQPAVPMNRRDFQRDCKYSPAPSRPYSDSDLLSTLTTREPPRSQTRFSVVPPIKRMTRQRAARVIQKNFRQYKQRRKRRNLNGVVKAKFVHNFCDKLIDELLMEEMLPDILVEVLLYGVNTLKLPSVQEGVIQEYADTILDETVYSMLHSSFSMVMSEIISVYSTKRTEQHNVDRFSYVIDELIAYQIRDTVNEFMKEYILDFQYERIYNQLLYEVISLTVYEEYKDVEGPNTKEKKDKASFDLDNIILASVLCKSLVPNDDYILDGIVAQGIANQLKMDNDSEK